ncbi:hypothetical protein [Saccharothrix luteola]|uniref:hypothetical protein n=1 Tax=Saccharothrix luteola TaxID=2893018 RepID=UPI001E3202D0|nr:hypothetical protein [Saccharothrix luteola]MCC8250280.1 hypothetical protein [Saccharothrix luteola]
MAATLEVHRATLDLAARHPSSESAAVPPEVAAQVYARMGLFQAATTMATRAVELRRDLSPESATEDRLAHHVFALDLLASTFRARGMTDAVTGCLVQLVELHFECDNAVAKFTRADELYAEYDTDTAIAEERGEPVRDRRLGRHPLVGESRYAATVSLDRVMPAECSFECHLVMDTSPALLTEDGLFAAVASVEASMRALHRRRLELPAEVLRCGYDLDAFRRLARANPAEIKQWVAQVALFLPSITPTGQPLPPSHPEIGAALAEQELSDGHLR